MKKIIHLVESQKTLGNTTIIYKGAIIKSSLVQSIISDFFTFGIMVFSFWVNYQFIHSKILSCILLFCFIFQLCCCKNKQVVSKEEFIKIMNKHLEEFDN
jgi:hypothetical protein